MAKLAFYWVLPQLSRATRRPAQPTAAALLSRRTARGLERRARYRTGRSIQHAAGPEDYFL